jgi:NADP-dependent 3-hydroxy acid dehydrogenase YdfG
MSNPVIIIVGAGPGIGAATARRFAAAGYDVGLIARDSARVEKLASELTKGGTSVGYAIVDAGDDHALTHALGAMGEHNGRLDVLLHNAVADRSGPVSAMTAADLQTVLRVESAALITSVQAVLPLLRIQHTGTVLATTRRGRLGASAVEDVVLRLAGELKGEGIHVATVAVSPGISEDLVAGAFTDLTYETAQDPASWRAVVELGTP